MGRGQEVYTVFDEVQLSILRRREQLDVFRWDLSAVDLIIRSLD